MPSITVEFMHVFFDALQKKWGVCTCANGMYRALPQGTGYEASGHLGLVSISDYLPWDKQWI